MIFAGLCASLEPIARELKLAEVEREHSRKMIGFGLTHGITASFRQLLRLLDKFCDLAQIGAHVIDVAEPLQRGGEITFALQLAAELLRALERRFCLA
ncbi:hypothetical protein [Bradyrhizobium sp. USDA 10063]